MSCPQLLASVLNNIDTNDLENSVPFVTGTVLDACGADLEKTKSAVSSFLIDTSTKLASAENSATCYLKASDKDHEHIKQLSDHGLLTPATMRAILILRLSTTQGILQPKVCEVIFEDEGPIKKVYDILHLRRSNHELCTFDTVQQVNRIICENSFFKDYEVAVMENLVFTALVSGTSDKIFKFPCRNVALMSSFTSALHEMLLLDHNLGRTVLTVLLDFYTALLCLESTAEIEGDMALEKEDSEHA